MVTCASNSDIDWTLDQVLLATGGRYIARKNAKLRNDGMSGSSVHFHCISTDSRAIHPGDIFLGLSGENFDGASFAPDAVKKGAAGLILNQAINSDIEEPTPSIPVVVVKDPLLALGDLAAYRRSRMKHLKVVAITGSSGKTTVKEMTSSVVSKKFNIVKTQGNFNNLVGLPLSLLPVKSQHEVAVLEMGMNQPGEIARLTEIADPDIACINNIQEAHLAGLGSIKGVAKAKGELFAGTKSWGTLVVNVDDPQVRILARKYRHRKITFGRRKGADIRATHIRDNGENGMTFTLHIGNRRVRLQIKAFGTHNVMNSLAAAAIASGLGISMSTIVKGLSTFKPYDKRSQIIHLASGLKVINDSYNANPASMQAALSALHNLKRERKTMAVLGDMFELGDKSKDAHSKLGQAAFDSGVDYLAATGEYAGDIIKTALQSGLPKERAKVFKNKNEISKWIKRLIKSGDLRPNDWLLIKGSRGMEMETVLEELNK